MVYSHLRVVDVRGQDRVEEQQRLSEYPDVLARPRDHRDKDLWAQKRGNLRYQKGDIVRKLGLNRVPLTPKVECVVRSQRERGMATCGRGDGARLEPNRLPLDVRGLHTLCNELAVHSSIIVL